MVSAVLYTRSWRIECEGSFRSLHLPGSIHRVIQPDHSKQEVQVPGQSRSWDTDQEGPS